MAWQPETNLTDLAISGIGISTGKLYPGSMVVNKFGFADAIGTNDPPLDVWSAFGNGGGNLYTYSTSADIDTISSSDGIDNQILQITGLNVNFEWTVQLATLNGQNKVVLTTPLIRVHRMQNVSNTDIAGLVYCYITGAAITAGVPNTPADVRALINNGNNITEMTQFTTPVNFRSFLVKTFVNIGSESGGVVKQADVEFRFKPFGASFILAGKSTLSNNGNGNIDTLLAIPPELPAKGDVVWRVTNVSANATTINAGFTILMIPS